MQLHVDASFCFLFRLRTSPDGYQRSDALQRRGGGLGGRNVKTSPDKERDVILFQPHPAEHASNKKPHHLDSAFTLSISYRKKLTLNKNISTPLFFTRPFHATASIQLRKHTHSEELLPSRLRKDDQKACALREIKTHVKHRVCVHVYRVRDKGISAGSPKSIICSDLSRSVEKEHTDSSVFNEQLQKY